ncbi:MAG TPA: patatin-like phospholipase family protein, partial [Clostridia bacterium]|nr:patatin-like phospholipase family protein [Clostridia bacterium]
MEKNSKRLALVLEGGGARGAYQAGVLKALFEAGYNFDGVAGTSVGALNGVMVAQNKFEDSLKIWNEIDFENVLGINNMYGENLANKSFDQDTIKYFYNYVKKLIGQRGLDTTKIKNLIKANIDEDILRNSGVDFGIMTYSLTEKQHLSIFVEDMPYGQVADYVMASASFPGFKKTVVEGQEYIDGGIYDNMPVNMMLDRVYKDVVAIETKSSIPKRKP